MRRKGVHLWKLFGLQNSILRVLRRFCLTVDAGPEVTSVASKRVCQVASMSLHVSREALPHLFEMQTALFKMHTALFEIHNALFEIHTALFEMYTAILKSCSALPVGRGERAID
jgi:hypothetical protein